VVLGLRFLICFAATTHASSSYIEGLTPDPCHFSIVAIGKRAMVSSAASVKPPPGPEESLPWKKAGKRSHDQTGPLQDLQGFGGGDGAGVGGYGVGGGLGDGGVGGGEGTAGVGTKAEVYPDTASLFANGLAAALDERR
jgi:hypothetical protein